MLPTLLYLYDVLNGIITDPEVLERINTYVQYGELTVTYEGHFNLRDIGQTH